MKDMNTRLAQFFFWLEKAVMGAIFAWFLTGTIMLLAENILPEAAVTRLGDHILYLTLPLGMLVCPRWWANWRFGWVKRSFLSGVMVYILIGVLGLYLGVDQGEVMLYRFFLVTLAMVLWPVLGVYFSPFQALPGVAAPAAEPGEPDSKLLLAAYLPVFGLLGWFTGLTVVQLFRALFTGTLMLRMSWLAFFIVCTVFAFRRYGVFRENQAEPRIPAIPLLALAWAFFLAGAAIAEITYRSPAAVLEDKFNSDQNACDAHAQSVLAVHGVSESHAPGTGHIVVKATFLARKPLIISGGDWTPHAPGSSAHFYSEVDRMELKPGEPREISIRVVLNPNVPTLPRLGVDGPYFISEIRGYVYDPTVTEPWGSRYGETSCRTALVRNLTTAAYKAADFTREEWSGNKDAAAPKNAALTPPLAATPEEAAKKKAESDQLIKEAQAVLQEADQELKDARESEKRVKKLISTPLPTVPKKHP